MWNKIKIYLKESWNNFISLVKIIVLKYGVIITIGTGILWLVTPRYNEYKESERKEQRRLDSLDLDRRFQILTAQLDSKIDTIKVEMTFDTSGAQYQVLLRDMKLLFMQVWNDAPQYINRYLDEEKAWILGQEVRVTDENGFHHYEHYIRISKEGVKPEIWQKVWSSTSIKNN